MRDQEFAEHLSVGLLVRRGAAVRWLNSAACHRLGERGFGQVGPGTAPPELLALLDEVAARPTAHELSWTAPDGSTRRWRMACAPWPSACGGEELLYEIVDLTVPAGPGLLQNAQTPASTPDGAWRLERLEALARLGTWEWSVADNGVHWSEALLRLFGFPTNCHLDYPTYRSLLHPDDVGLIENTLAEALRTGEPFTYTHRMYLADRVTERVFECYGEVIVDDDGQPVRVLGTAQDITEQHHALVQLEFLAGHDPLTGLANRRKITDRLSACASDSAGGALLLIDVDNFKDINDLRGHAVGDQVMRSLARLLPRAVRPDMLLGRLGGDEFAVVAPGSGAADAVDLAEQICDLVSRTPAVVGGAPLHVSASIGVALVEPGREYEVALGHADLALYEAKGAGRNRARLFADDQYHQAVRRVSVLQRVGDALDRGGLVLHAQPIVGIGTSIASRHELLIRLRDGRGPDLEPNEFLPATERTDLVVRLDRWVIAQAVDALARPAARRSALRLEVNVSARSLDDPTLAEWILAELHRARVEPGSLGLEITETAAITSLDAARALATPLVKAGCGFTLDDFGAGFGSFAYLKHLPFTAVKIAGEFVRQVDRDPVDRALVDSVVRVAHQLGMSTVAEHVDRPELLETLRRLGVDDAQGFHLGRPRPLAELLATPPALPRPRTADDHALSQELR